jgi:O-antigen ligase
MSKKRPKPKAGPPPAKPLPLDRVLLYVLAFTLFALPLFFFPGLSEYGYGKTMFALVAISVLSILWALSAWQKGDWSLRIPWITFPFFLFVLAALLSLIAATNGRVVVQSLLLSVYFFQLAFLVANVARKRRDVNLLLSSVVLSAFFVSLYGLLQYLDVLQGADAGGLNTIISTLGNKNFVGGLLGYLLLPSFVLMVRLRSRVLRVVALGVIAFNFGTLMLVSQMAPVIGLIFAGLFLIVGFVLFRPIEPIRRNRSWLIALLGILVLTFLIEAPSGPLNSVVGLSQDSQASQAAQGWLARMWEKNSGATRELDWWVGWEMLKDRPITGVGLGNYKIDFLRYKADFLDTPRGAAYDDLKIPRAAQAHGDYVQAAAELGGLGILALLSFFGIFAVSVWKRLRSNPDEGDRLDILLYTAGLVVFFVHALVSFPAHLPASMMAVLLLLGLIHAPAYGDACLFRLRIRKRVIPGIAGALAVIGVTVSAFAISDLAADVLMSRGLQQLQFGETEQAKETLERSIALDFAPRQTYYYLATALVQLGDYEAALDNYKKCFTRFTDENAYLVFADLAIDVDRAEEARDAIQFLLSTNPKREIEEKARYIEGTVAVQLGDYNGAVRLMESLAEDAPDFEMPLIALGNLYGGLGQTAAARERFTAALELIEEELDDVQTTLATRTRFTANEYSTLRQSLTRLQNERSYVLEQLARLPID